MENKKDSLKFIIQRYDVYISSSNVKGSFLLTLNALIITLCLGNLSDILGSKAERELLSIIAVLTLLASCTVAIVFVVLAIYPFTSSGNNSLNKYHSKIFFGSVREFQTGRHYWNSIKEFTDEEFEEDMAYQAHTLAVGLHKKFKFLKIASWFIYIDLILIAIIFVNKILVIL